MTGSRRRWTGFSRNRRSSRPASESNPLVDHPLTAPDALIRPWRTAAFIAATIAAVELLVLLAIGGGALVRVVSHRVEQAATNHVLAPPKATKRITQKPTNVAAKVPRKKVRVLVLNGNGRQGAAAVAASRVQRRGYRIGGVANAPRSDFARSIVMYKPGFVGEGRRLGRDLGVRLVTPLDGMRARQLKGAHLVFILGA
jgi:LytR cell envelope-related transcriptional attenuator